jgi:hypothetical protein
MQPEGSEARAVRRVAMTRGVPEGRFVSGRHSRIRTRLSMGRVVQPVHISAGRQHVVLTRASRDDVLGSPVRSKSVAFPG